MQKSTRQESQLETFICKLCEQEFAVMHEPRYEMHGKLTKVGKEEISEEIHIHICEYCVCSKLIEVEDN